MAPDNVNLTTNMCTILSKHEREVLLVFTIKTVEMVEMEGQKTNLALCC